MTGIEEIKAIEETKDPKETKDSEESKDSQFSIFNYQFYPQYSSIPLTQPPPHPPPLHSQQP